MQLYWQMKSKIIFILLLFFVGLEFSFGQKTLENFDGDLTFKESFFYIPISRTVVDTVTTFSWYEKDDEEIEITEFPPGDRQIPKIHNIKSVYFEPIIFYKNKDSIFYKYVNPYRKGNDSSRVKLFSLSFKDTIIAAPCYKLIIDTLRRRYDTTSVVHINCYEDSREFKTYRVKDTTLIFKEYKLDCYTFEQKKYLEWSGRLITRIVLVHKNTLIPVDIKEYTLLTRERGRYFYLEPNKNLLTYHQKLIDIIIDD